ncbi:hypothetical protein L914_09814 [Phytophthora nicotianae]|uniref:Uncharacterized protein n=3 Tax=Phytophthora nicotianae TaxID=4792 RepID=V9F250_PHYNI|nr:hypothetical protein F443_10148 [Phytophthora nicotianae P1569]ETM44986.1 hypothetical protein L914_09814 [Phytophthora nicotianae]ETO73822.1 hypothetical protein F444_10245 [Phytophthora nicotianae P1976]
MLAVTLKRMAACCPAVYRSFSSRTKVWDLFPAPEMPVVKPAAPQYMMNMRDNLEFALERMRLTEGPVALQLLNRNARRPKKANHGKRPCSHYRRRLKRLGRRSDK